ncbi:recombinase family protein [Streptomyces sp. NPDC006704]|uniref:recombinase family protein n=1 Tax=Streptomyces sp. NPDC006704 TaxID=3364760 RepID=UPI0036A02D34
MPNSLLIALATVRKRRLRAIIYIRVSKDRPDMESPDEQLYACMQYADANNVDVFAEAVVDLGLSGTTFAKRQVAEIIERIRLGEADLVIVWKWNRFGRNNAENQVNLKALQEAGGELCAATEDIDTSTYHGRFSRDTMLNVAELQAGIIGATWKDTAARRRRNQLPHTGAERFGYVRCKDCRRSEENPKNYVSCATCKGVLQRDWTRGPALAEFCWRYTDGGEPARALSTEMLARGIRSLRGNVMPPGTWLSVMDTGFFAGLLRGRSIPDKNLYSSNKPETYDVWTQGKHTPWIQMDLWERYVEKRTYRSGPKWNRAPKYAFTSLARCWALNKAGEVCKSPMSRATSGQYKTPVYKCTSTAKGTCAGVMVTVEKLNTAIFKWLSARATDEDAGFRAMRRSAEADVAESEIPTVKREIAAHEAELNRATDFAVKGLLSENDFRDRKETLEAQISQKKARVAVLERMAGIKAMPTREDFMGFVELWPKMTPLEQRDCLLKIVDRIEVHKTPGHQPNKIVIISKEEAIMMERESAQAALASLDS